jgi:hypothetical protein
MAKPTKCYLLVLCERIGEGQQILSVYTSAKQADKNMAAYQRSQEQALESRNMFVAVLECELNKTYE